MTTFPLQLKEVKRQNQDHEWYPTTDEIIQTLVRSIKQSVSKPGWRSEYKTTFLDIGAGNGKVLKAIGPLENIGRLFAIEKSSILLDLLPPEVMVLGVDFWKTSLVDKDLTVVFSNPPYSEYVQWTEKIIRECSSSTLVYLVIPERWEKSEPILRALQARNLKPEILGRYDFLESEDRQARAKVHLLKLKFPASGKDPADPFSTFFDATFSYPEEEPDLEEPEETYEEKALGRKLNQIESLVHSHNARLVSLQQNYHDICKIPASLLLEFGIDREGIRESLRQKLVRTKSRYWSYLFDELESIKSKLTSASRDKMRELMTRETGIEFTLENAYAVVGWVIKNANSYFDDQLVATYGMLIEYANVENYKSNHKVFVENRFGYDAVNDKVDSITHYRLKVGHRLVLHRAGGLNTKYYSCDKGDLSERGATFICDLLVVANNLGFTPVEEGPCTGAWTDTGAKVYHYLDSEKKKQSLFRLRTFRNNNIHIQLNPEFVHALNVQHGKIKRWLPTAAEAADELEIPIADASKYFNAALKLEMNTLALLQIS